MNLGPTSSEEAFEAIASECETTLEQGSLPMMQLIAKSMLKGGIPVRVWYMMGGIKAIGSMDKEVLHSFFSYLKSQVPPEEQGIHDQAVEIVFTNLVKKVLDDTKETVDMMAKCIGVNVKLVFSDSVKTEPQEPEEVPLVLH